MMTADLLIAAVLIAGPVDVDPAIAEVFRPQIIAVALAAELADQREIGFVSLAELRCRWNDLADAPGLADGARFPGSVYTRRALEINRARRLRLTERLEVDMVWADEIRAEIEALDQLYDVISFDIFV